MLSQLIGSVANDCTVTPQPPTPSPPTPQPPTPSPPTPSPPTPSPPTYKPPTVRPPTVQPPTVQPPTGQPPTGQPPTVRPPTVRPPSPNPNSCYRRYCRKWRTRPSYLCYKNCGGNFTYKPKESQDQGFRPRSSHRKRSQRLRISHFILLSVALTATMPLGIYLFCLLAK